MTGYYLGESPNLMGMQTGGSFGKPQPFGKPKTRGAALLARALQKQDDLGLLEDYQREEAERQKRGGLFGSVLGTVGGLAGGLLGPGGAAIGTSLGKGLGERLGAGKAKDYDESGTVYAQESFRDIDEASDEYNKGMLGRSLMAGAQAGLTAGLTPGGGQYGQYNPFTESGRQGIKALSMGKGVTGYSGGTGELFSKSFFGTPNYINTPLATPKVADATPYLDRLFGGGVRRLSLEDGGYIGMQNGGFTAQTILEQQGMTATPEQLALFQGFDTTGVGKASQQLGQGLLGMTAGQGLSSGGGGFGAQQSAIAQAVEGGQKSLEDQIQDEQTAYQSQVLGTAADIVTGGGEFGKVTTAPSVVTSLPSVNQGAVNYLGQTYVWSEEEGQYVSIGNFNLSDIRLKENINLVGLSDSGINIYTFEYKDKRHGDGVYSGVMAQDVPWASFEADNGYLAVDYSKVDVSFEQVA
tara:strand:- start:2216 stop:3616 length:1401 start_codon:yes stop_codon:yes gene_type:complete